MRIFVAVILLALVGTVALGVGLPSVNFARVTRMLTFKSEPTVVWEEGEVIAESMGSANLTVTYPKTK